MLIRCDPCRDNKHECCAGSVSVFDQDGPNYYGCECYCARLRRERREADRVLRLTVEAYERRYGREALLTAVGAASPSETDHREDA